MDNYTKSKSQGRLPIVACVYMYTVVCLFVWGGGSRIAEVCEIFFMLCPLDF